MGVPVTPFCAVLGTIAHHNPGAVLHPDSYNALVALLEVFDWSAYREPATRYPAEEEEDT